MTIKDIADKHIQRLDKSDGFKPIVLPDVELIPASRCDEPLRGDRVADRWNNRFGGMIS
jgi:hypothetical protein